jgi:prepilin peptidase CpaA
MTAIAAYTDWRTGEIPNWLTLPAIGLAPVVYGILLGWPGVFASLSGIVVCGLLPYFLFKQGGMGGGDVKLFAAMGGIGGIYLGFEAQGCAFVAGAVFAVVRIAVQGGLLAFARSCFWIAVNPFLPRRYKRTIEPTEMIEMRLGPSILAGTLIAAFAL